MRGKVGRQLHFSRDERLCQIVEAVVILERGGDSPTVHSISKEIGMRPSTRVRGMCNDLAAVGMFNRVETMHWNKTLRYVYKINPHYVEIPDLAAFSRLCKGYGYQIPLSGFDSSITHDKSTKP